MDNFNNQLNEYLFCPRCKDTLVTQTIDKSTVKTCKSCGFIFWNDPKPVVSILLHKNDTILMLQRTNEPFQNFWVLPGGFMKYTETPQEAILRETKEETGMDVQVESVLGVYRIDNDPRGIHIDIIFTGTPHGEVTLSKEDKNWQYFSASTLPDNIAYKHRNAIKDWMLYRKT